MDLPIPVRGGEKFLPRPGHRIILSLAVSSPWTHSTSYSWLLKGFVDPENESDLFSLASRRKFARDLLKQWRLGYVRYGHIPNARHPRAKDVEEDLPSCRRSSPGRAHLIDRQWSGRGAGDREEIRPLMRVRWTRVVGKGEQGPRHS